MNYRHAFHAGNFADVWKHAALVACLDRLALKDKPYRVVDLFAGAGLYDLEGPEAARSPEWRDGWGRVAAAADPPDLIGRYRDAVAAASPAPGLYPGSPALIQAALGPAGRATFCELHPEDCARLRANLDARGADGRRGRSGGVRVLQSDGWAGVRALLPPPERRGLALIDPPFERPGELERLADALATGLKRWRGGMFLLWHAGKEPAAVDAMRRSMADACGPDGPQLLAADLAVGHAGPGRGLVACGLTIANPPMDLEVRLTEAGTWLGACLGRDSGAGARIWRLAGQWQGCVAPQGRA